METLQQQNDRLQKQVLTSQEITTLIQSSVQNAIAKSRADTSKDIAQANDDLHKDILTEVTTKIQELAADTNVQLKKLAAAISDKPIVTQVTAPPPGNLPRRIPGISV